VTRVKNELRVTSWPTHWNPLMRWPINRTDLGRTSWHTAAPPGLLTSPLCRGPDGAKDAAGGI